MDEMVKQLASPVFWFGTVAVGLVLNLASNVIQRQLDQVFARRREERRRLAEAEDQWTKDQLTEIYEHPVWASFYAAQESRLMWAALGWMASSLVLLAFMFMNLALPLGENATLNFIGAALTTLAALQAGRIALMRVRSARQLGDLLELAHGALRSMRENDIQNGEG